MKHVKILLAACMIVGITLSCCACGGKKPEKTTAGPTGTTAPTVTTGAPITTVIVTEAPPEARTITIDESFSLIYGSGNRAESGRVWDAIRVVCPALLLPQKAEGGQIDENEILWKNIFRAWDFSKFSKSLQNHLGRRD